MDKHGVALIYGTCWVCGRFIQEPLPDKWRKELLEVGACSAKCVRRGAEILREREHNEQDRAG